MSHAELERDSASAVNPVDPVANPQSGAMQPPAPPAIAPSRAGQSGNVQARTGQQGRGNAVPAPPSAPAVGDRVPAVGDRVPARTQGQPNRAPVAETLAEAPAAVPPPPPPRSTLPPVRPVPEGKVASGVGSAKGVRWRGELDEVNASSSAPPKSSGPAPSNGASPEPVGGDQEEETATDHVSREAPPWLVSMVLHLILLLILALISTPAGSSLGRVMLSIGQSEQETPSELAEFSISAQDDVLEETELMEDAEAEVDLSELFEAPELNEIEVLEPTEIGAGAEMVQIRPMFNGRSGAMKKALMEIYGGTPETQDAVRRGLEWLKRNQKRNGGWSMRGPYDNGGLTENECAATSMALLAFLGDGHTHKSGDYSKQVERGIKYLIGMQDRSGFFARDARPHEKMYAQAQATIAICELYGMTKDSWLRDRAQLAIDFAEKAQSEQGGWRYEPKFDSDTSVTGWYVMALESGRSAGLAVDISILLKVNDYLDTAASYDGAGYGYQARSGPTPAMTAEGLLCRQYIAWQRNHPPLLQGIKALLLDAPFSLSDRDVYYWYYATQVLHHYGGSPWREWNEVMRVELPKAQVKGGREDGSWAPQMDRWGRNHGRLYTTCLSLYCLEVYYRHMPLYKADGQQIR